MKTSKKVAVLATDGFEQSELLDPSAALQEAGASVVVVTPEGEAIRGWKDKEWGQTIKADASLGDADPNEFDALLLPGGVINSDALRTSTAAQHFVKHFFEKEKPVFAICHGAQILIDAELVDGRKMTSYHAISADLINAGAEWENSEVVEDGRMISSRDPDDLPAFCSAICRALGLSKSQAA
ncbi:type 1 glutamine amidotransferase [Luteolibacter flavescens]|uniref:Type 1 glutamine amidotransferase n=1 Tax=Luteolibacter flavescens TaxID=1859460 RepID=A0ABT3FR00_9BACT|nr:type 1 glutamine amidotransferase domain-containing protein [Luteolibacter flavescens]MCW1886021.1 type 1 glutamine amidotransferase [Luteolibacter flavescens]